MEIERHRGLIRFALIYLTVTIGLVAVWILIAPKGFYDNFPGGGTHWVSALPPYNEHLERDFGAAGAGPRRARRAGGALDGAARGPGGRDLPVRRRPPPPRLPRDHHRRTTRPATTSPASPASRSTCCCRWRSSTWSATTPAAGAHGRPAPGGSRRLSARPRSGPRRGGASASACPRSRSARSSAVDLHAPPGSRLGSGQLPRPPSRSIFSSTPRSKISSTCSASTKRCPREARWCRGRCRRRCRPPARRARARPSRPAPRRRCRRRRPRSRLEVGARCAEILHAARLAS